jgi:hypothetical protein
MFLVVSKALFISRKMSWQDVANYNCFFNLKRIQKLKKVGTDAMPGQSSPRWLRGFEQ